MSEEESGGVVDHEGVLVMPFVAVQSRGGPFDDLAYACGHEVGYVTAALERGEGVPLELAMPVHRENVEQFDLVGMRFGFTMEQQPYEDDPSWVYVTFRPVEAG